MVMESLDAFRQRARDWLAGNLPRLPADAQPWNGMRVGTDEARRAKELQALLFEAGFAGLCFPKEYGGQGLAPEYQRAFGEEAQSYEMPLLFNTPTFTIIAPTILDLGTEAQKRRHLPAMIRGEELWVQFMSEPSGGSDLAGAITSAKFDGDNYLLNGSKIWSSYAAFSDYAICLARTDWDAVKHQGLTMFIVKIHQPGVEVNQIRQSDGGAEFCQEFFDDVPIPLENVLGKVNDGWTSAQRLLFHERSASGGASPYAVGVSGRRRDTVEDLVRLARARERSDDSHVRDLIAEIHVLQTVQAQTIERVTKGIASQGLPPTSGAVPRLFGSLNGVRRSDVTFEIAGTESIAWERADSPSTVGNDYIFRQAWSLGGGSVEMQRNIISERVLGMPREAAADRGMPFKEVRRNAPSK